MGITYAHYAIAALAIAMALAIKTDRKFLAFVLVTWVMAQPVLEFGFTLRLPSLDLTPNRMLFLSLLGYAAVMSLLGIKSGAGVASAVARAPFEKYIYIYLAMVFVSLAVNYANIRPQDIIVVPVEIITFIVVYLVAKRFATVKVLEAVLMAVIITAAMGAVIAFIQYAIDTEFMRTRDVRVAFGDIKRSTGIFPQEYDFGAFQLMGIMATIFRFRGTVLVYMLVPLIALSVVLTFHRLDMLILIACLVVYFLFYTNAARKGMLVAVLVTAAVAYPLIKPVFEHSAVVSTVEGRIGQDTVTGRLRQYQVVAKQILTDYTLVGVGAYENPAYDALMINNGMVNYTKDGKKIGFRVHNGYLEVGILKGVIAMFAFTIFFVSMLTYFIKNSSRIAGYSGFPVFVVLIYMLINMSNGISSFAFYVSLLCAMLAGLFVMYDQQSQRSMGRVGEEEASSMRELEEVGRTQLARRGTANERGIFIRSRWMGENGKASE